MLRLFRQYYPIRNIFFVMGECLIIFLSVFMACIFLLEAQDHLLQPWLWLKIFLITFSCQVCLYFNDLYDLNGIDSFLELGIRLVQALGIAAIFLAVIYFIFPKAMIAKGIFIVSLGLIIILFIAWRFFYKIVLDRGIFNQKIILLGSGDLAQDIMKEIMDKKDCGYAVPIRIVDRFEDMNEAEEKNQETKRDSDTLCNKAKKMGIEKIVVAMKDKRGLLPMRELLECRVNGIDVVEGNSFYEMLTGKLIVEHINPAWLIFTRGFKKTFFQSALKRLVDLVISIALLIVFLPAVLIIAVLIKFDSKGSIVFSQDRVGKGHKIYRIYKFRSMIDNAEERCGPIWADDEDPRVTRVGHYIRKWRIDEVPQLWNVFKGNMSFVGPRPERPFFIKKLEAIIPYYRERFSVKPGITGWAQVCYGYGASVRDAVKKLNYDLFYIKNLSIMMDLMIIFKTIKVILFAKGSR